MRGWLTEDGFVLASNWEIVWRGISRGVRVGGLEEKCRGKAERWKSVVVRRRMKRGMHAGRSGDGASPPKRRRTVTTRGNQSDVLQLLDLPDDAIRCISRFLPPWDRLNLAFVSKRLFSVVWDSRMVTSSNDFARSWPSLSRTCEAVWLEMISNARDGFWGQVFQARYQEEMERRNIEYATPRQLVLRFSLGVCIGCCNRPSGSEKVTGLSLCKECLCSDPMLGVTSRTNAMRMYFLNSQDMQKLGERSAVVEYDYRQNVVYRVHYYHRCLRRRALGKFGGEAGFEREKRRRKEIRERRNRTISMRRQARSDELESGFQAIGLSLMQGFSSVGSEGKEAPPVVYPWELELDYEVRQYINLKVKDDRRILQLARATEVKVFFEEKTCYADHYREFAKDIRKIGLSAVVRRSFDAAMMPFIAELFSKENPRHDTLLQSPPILLSVIDQNVLNRDRLCDLEALVNALS